MSVIHSLGKETPGYTDPPAMHLNKVRESITGYRTSIIIAVIDNVVARLMWRHVWSRGQWHSCWDGKPCCCSVMGWCLAVWYTALVYQDLFGLRCSVSGWFWVEQLCSFYSAVCPISTFPRKVANFYWHGHFTSVVQITLTVEGLSHGWAFFFSFKWNLNFRKEIEWIYLFLSEKNSNIKIGLYVTSFTPEE